MPKEVTIKVGYVLGSTKGLSDGAKHADQMASNIKGAGQAAAGSMQEGLDKLAKEQADEGNKKSIGGTIKKSLDNVAGGFGLFKWIAAAGAAAAAIGKVSADSHMLAGGAMLRGQGISGMVTGAYDFMSGRGTKEGLQDLKLGQQDFYIGQIAQKMERAFEKSTALRETQFKPITEVDPLKRQVAEMVRLNSQRQQIANDMEKAQVKFSAERGEMANGRFMNMRVGAGGAFVDEVGELKSKIAEGQAMVQYKTQLKDIAKQELDLVAQQVQQRKEAVRSSALSFGAKTPLEQDFLKRAGARLNAGEELMPEEIGALGGVPMAQDKLNKYLMKRAGAGRFNEFAESVGDATVAGAARASVQVGGSIDVSIEKMQDFDRVFNRVKDVNKKLQDDIDDIKADMLRKDAILHNRVTVDRKLQIPGGR